MERFEVHMVTVWTGKMLFFTLIQFLPWWAFGNCNEYNDTEPVIKIIGGEPISIKQVPYMALFRAVGESFWCGASIVSDQFLITACHCVEFDKNKTMEVTVGTDKALSGGQKYQVEKIVKHPQCYIAIAAKQIPANYDVAVIKLKKKLTFSDKVQPIQLAERGIVIDDSAVFRVSGFGKTEFDHDSNQLLSVTVPYVPPKNCSAIYINIDITDQMICAGTYTKGPYFGDSGGPLVYGDKLVGVVSFGSHRPSVYARISALRDFIDQIVNDN